MLSMNLIVAFAEVSEAHEYHSNTNNKIDCAVCKK